VSTLFSLRFLPLEYFGPEELPVFGVVVDERPFVPAVPAPRQTRSEQKRAMLRGTLQAFWSMCRAAFAMMRTECTWTEANSEESKDAKYLGECLSCTSLKSWGG